MKSIRPEDRTKAVALTVLALTVFVLAGWRAKTSLAGPEPAATVAASPNAAVSVTKDSPVAKESDKQVVIADPSVSRKKDPFQPVASTGNVDHSKSTENPITNLHSSYDEPPMTGSISNQPVDVAPNQKEDVAPARPSVLPTPNIEVRKDPEMIEVMGIVTGPKGIAIFRIQDRQYVVTQGDSFGDGYVLKSVSDTGVLVRQGNRLITLSAFSAGSERSESRPVP